MVLDRYLVAKGLMGPFEVVFNKPIGKAFVELLAIRYGIAHSNEFILDRTIETFIKGIVCGGFGA